MSNHLIAEANRHAKALGKITLPTTQPTQRDIQWYVEECIDLRKQLNRECASKREHLRIACDEINKLKVQVGIYERENAALRAWKESALAVRAEMDEQAIAKMLGGELGRSCRKIIAERVPELVKENAELRKDKERLDWLEEARPIAWALGSAEIGEYWLLTDIGEKHPEEAEEFATLREAIDAAMQEGTQ